MKNKYEIRGDVTVIFLKKRDGTILETLIETKDLEKVNGFPGTWSLSHANSSRPSVHTWLGIDENKKRKFIFLHRYLTNPPDNLLVDHINGNPLDNRRSNLRIGDQYLNMQNLKGASKNSKSGVLGVYWSKYHNKWVASFRNKHLGYFDSVEEAGKIVESIRATYAPFSKEARNLKDVIEVNIPVKVRLENQSGIKGITWYKPTNRWKVRITKDGKRISLGYFKNVEDALQAQLNALQAE